MKQWFVAYTQLGKETVAEQHLVEQGFEAYLPRFRKIRRHARKTDKVLAPLFPRYLFVGMDEMKGQWRSVQGTRGVSYLLVNGSRPALVPFQILQGLKDRQNEEGLVPVSSLALFEKGDRVRVSDGVFKEHIGIFDKMDDKQRVQLLLNCLGRDVKVSLPSHAVEAA